MFCITMCDKAILLPRATGCYYKVRQILQSVKYCYFQVCHVTQSVTDVITKCVRYYKV